MSVLCGAALLRQDRGQLCGLLKAGRAHQNGYARVPWLDGVEPRRGRGRQHEHHVRADGKIVTPAGTSIPSGITRNHPAAGRG